MPSSIASLFIYLNEHNYVQYTIANIRQQSVGRVTKHTIYQQNLRLVFLDTRENLQEKLAEEKEYDEKEEEEEEKAKNQQIFFL